MTTPQNPYPNWAKPPQHTTRDAIGGVPGTVVAMVTAVAGLLTTWLTAQQGEAVSRAAYEALKTRTEELGAQNAALREDQLLLRGWVEDLSERLERRQTLTETAIAKKVTKPAQKPTLPSVEPVPKAPPPPPAPAPSPLPAFEALTQNTRES